MIKDDNGKEWHFNPRTQRLNVEGDLEEDGGYFCRKEEDIEIELARHGYIYNTDRRICIVLKMLARRFSNNRQELELIDGILRDLEENE